MFDRLHRPSVIVTAVVVAVHATVLASGALDAETTSAVANVAECLAPALAGSGCWRASKRAPMASLSRAWRLLAASAVSWSLGQVVWTYYSVSATQAPFPSAADAGYLLAVPLALAGVWHLSAGPLASTRAVATIDGLIVAGGLLAISWPLVLGPSWDAGGDRPLIFALSLAYPVGNLVVASCALLAMMRIGRRHGPVPLVAIGVALLVLVGADSIFVLATLRGTEDQTSVADVGWVVGYLVMFVAARSFPVANRGEEPAAAGATNATLQRALVPFTVVAISMVVRLVLALTGYRTDGFLMVVTALTLSLVLLRQLLTMAENQRLTRSLEDKIGELTAREGQLSHQALHDPLTGLANRRLFADRVEHALALGRRSGQVTAVLFVDLDDFKTVNDSLGHAVGDQLLAGVGARLGGCVRDGDTVARLGGDEFGILLEEVDDRDHPARVAARVLDALDVAFPVQGRQVYTGASVGYALADTNWAVDGPQLLADADVALYAAKSAGKATLRSFEPTMRTSAMERLELGQHLYRAVEADEIFCEYQPIVDLVTERIVAVEALARWAHPERGVIAPGAFVDMAEENGTISAIGHRVLEVALDQVDRWRNGGLVPEDFELHVNLSGRQLEQPDLVHDVAALLAEHDFPVGQLVLEITESVAVDVGARHLDQLQRLRGLGLRLAIDDFGTGYSSLNYLRALPVDVLKIDRAFAGTADGATDIVLLEAIVRMGHSLGIDMIAEGIERQDQAATLRSLGCRRAQGYLFHRPVGADRIPSMVAAGDRAADPRPSLRSGSSARASLGID